MTDNEIIKALECCGSEINFCADCPYYLQDKENDFCEEDMNKDALDLINRQKAEIERLETNKKEAIEKLKIAMGLISETKDCVLNDIKKAKSEAIKEFAERLKEKNNNNKAWFCGIFNPEIDNLVKEMMDCQ